MSHVPPKDPTKTLSLQFSIMIRLDYHILQRKARERREKGWVGGREQQGSNSSPCQHYLHQQLEQKRGRRGLGVGGFCVPFKVKIHTQTRTRIHTQTITRPVLRQRTEKNNQRELAAAATAVVAVVVVEGMKSSTSNIIFIIIDSFYITI